jgi:hypothetical protein
MALATAGLAGWLSFLVQAGVWVPRARFPSRTRTLIRDPCGEGVEWEEREGGEGSGMGGEGLWGPGLIANRMR